MVKDLLGLRKNKWGQCGALFPGIQAGKPVENSQSWCQLSALFAINCEPLGSPVTA